MKISVIIVTYNCANVIEQCLESCLNTSRTDIEFVIVDNHSTDLTREILNRFKLNKRIKYVFNKLNVGYTAACNQGIRLSTGRYIMLLNPDAYLNHPEDLICLSNYLDNNPECGAIAPVLIYPDGSIQNYTRRFPCVEGLAVESFVPKKLWKYFNSYQKYTYQDIDFSILNYVEQPAAAALMIRSGILMDESYFVYGSDVDLCKTIIEQGLKIVQYPYVKIFHHQSQGGTNHGGGRMRMYLDLDNYYGIQYYFKKHNQPTDLMKYKIIFSIGLFLTAIFSIRKGFKFFNVKVLRFIYFLKGYNLKKFV